MRDINLLFPFLGIISKNDATKNAKNLYLELTEENLFSNS